MSSLGAEKDAMSSFRCPIDVSMMVTIDHNLLFWDTCDIVKRNYDDILWHIDDRNGTYNYQDMVIPRKHSRIP